MEVSDMRPSYTRAAIVSIVLLLAPGARAAERGSLLIIGGGTRGAAIMQRFVALAGGARARVVVFPMASGEAAATGVELVQEMHALGIQDATSLNLDRTQADDAATVRKLDGVTGVYFAGGDQARLTAALGGTRTEARLHELYAGGAVMAGTSAGAAVMSEIMITGDERRPVSKDDAFQKIEAENVVTTPGFGFLKDAIVDQHFVRRRRFNRLLSLVLEHPTLVGIGIDEATAIWVKPDHTFEVVGEGPVLVVDPRGAEAGRDTGSPGLRGAGMTLHVLRDGSVFDLTAHRVTRLR
jgi:cyanophycinase